jgi:hypothetical protein
VIEKNNVKTYWIIIHMIAPLILKRAQPPFSLIYNLSQDECVTLHEYINENLEKGFI